MSKPTLNGVIEKVDSLKANAFPPERKTEWINKVDGMVQTEILGTPEADMIVYSWDTDANTELLVGHPYSDIYEYYLLAMIDFYNNEIGSYENDMIMFNNAYEEYGKYYQRVATPAATTYVKNIW